MSESAKQTTKSVEFVEISADLAGQRVDNFLISRLKGVPKSMIYRILRKGEVRVNKGRIKPEYRLQAGDLLRIPPVRQAEAKEAPLVGDRLLKLIESRILFEDKRILVLNKPSGLAVHGGSGVSYGVIEALRLLRPDCKQLELVHRLDRETSGCLILAKKRSALRTLHEALRQGKVDKQYLALVAGKWQGGSRWVDAPLLKNVLSSGERIVRVNPEGKEARSQLIPEAVGEQASLMRVQLDTGRTHQIRVHAAHIGHPIAGDSKYGDETFNKFCRGLGLKRLFLHAQSLSFHLSEDEPAIYIEAALDPELTAILNKMNLSA